MAELLLQMCTQGIYLKNFVRSCESIEKYTCKCALNQPLDRMLAEIFRPITFCKFLGDVCLYVFVRCPYYHGTEIVSSFGFIRVRCYTLRPSHHWWLDSPLALQSAERCPWDKDKKCTQGDWSNSPWQLYVFQRSFVSKFHFTWPGYHPLRWQQVSKSNFVLVIMTCWDPLQKYRSKFFSVWETDYRMGLLVGLSFTSYLDYISADQNLWTKLKTISSNEFLKHC